MERLLKLNIHEEEIVEDEEVVLEEEKQEEIEVEDIADDDKGFVAFMKKIFVGEQEKQELEYVIDEEDKTKLALKYKNRYKEKYATQLEESNNAKELSDLKLSIATSKTDGQPFDAKYLDFVALEIQKSGEKAEDWLAAHTEYFEKKSVGAPIVKTNMVINDADQEYINFLKKQRQ